MPEQPRDKSISQGIASRLWDFLKHLGPGEAVPGTTGVAALKKSMLREHGPISLQDQARANTAKK